ncbi:MAG: sulfatase [Candidatus Marinimicrobia bacterium]|jgi:phosphoglycerol transferase MdoB-like AlkP superfamily enzyme|nr:sulfatase [Candidatus Neomarinimicrobiota bacterium]MDP7436571.1 sulfatase-like hydrolase/transferase [Candidatus Neomarinimicrobiota bacterium]
MNFSFMRSRRLRYLLGAVSLSWLFFILFRIVFFYTFNDPVADVSASDLTRAFWMGVRFDLRLAILISLPLLVLTMIPVLNMGRSHRTRTVGKWIYGILIIGAVLFYTADFGHYAYLQQRVDITALILLENPTISAQMVWESYPVVWFLSILALLCFTWIKLHDGLVAATVAKTPKYRNTSHKVVGVIVGGTIYLFSLWGTFAQYALFWSDAFFSRDPFVSALALNPVLYFYDTSNFSEADFDIEKVREYYPTISNWLGVAEPDQDNMNFTREIIPDKKIEPPPNIVIIFMESVGLNRMRLMGNPFDTTPTLDQLAKNGLFFPNFYVPWVSTSRSVFTMVTGIPDVARTKTSSRNPLIRDQYSIISEFVDHDKYYLIGGSASWANIRSLITYNLKDMELLELGDFNRPRVDVWGISDLDLLREAHDLFSKRDSEKPFFAIVQTAANHRPYSIPEDNAGFIIKNQDEQVLQKAGFNSLDQYNAMRFLDHSIGRFMEMANTADYFKNTIFVLFGDHGNADPQAEHMPADDYALRLRSYNVPFIIYAPGLGMDHRRIETVCGLPDLMPTIAGLSGIDYTNKTLGRDVLKNENGMAFVVNKKISPSSYGVLDSDYYLRIFRNGSGMEFHDLNSPDPAEDILSGNEEMVKNYERMTLGILETAKYMLYHNRN